jgi:hypothetical protein
MSTLAELAEKHGTDKGESKHGYTKTYDELFGGLPKDARIRLLEMGIWHGGSMLMWEEFFPNGHIVGTDVDPTALRKLGPRITCEFANQADPTEMRRVCEAHGPFDIIIDDAGHIGLCQLKAFYMLFPMFLLPGGVYIIEDITLNEDHTALDHFRNGALAVPYLDIAKVCILPGNTPKSGLIVITKTAAPEYMLVKFDDPVTAPGKIVSLDKEAQSRGLVGVHTSGAAPHPMIE